MIRLLLFLIVMALIVWGISVLVAGLRPVRPQPGRTVSRAEPAALEAPAEPPSEFLAAWDLRLGLTGHDAVLERLRARGLGDIAQQFDAAHRPCPRVDTGLHDFVDHTVELMRFSEPHGRIVHNWRCRHCGAATDDADLIGQSHFRPSSW